MFRRRELMHKVNCIRYRLLIMLFLITVLFGACADSQKTEKAVTIKADRLDLAGLAGSIDTEIQYLPESGGVYLAVTNNTAYAMTIDDPAVLYIKTLGEMYEALYPSLSDLSQGTAVIAGNELLLQPGDSRVIDILPHAVKLSQGEYRIRLGSMELVDPRTEEVRFHRQNETIDFSITK